MVQKTPTPTSTAVPRPSPLPARSESRQQDETIGTTLRQTRKQSWGNRGSLARTAEMAGVSVALLSLIERGEHPLSKVRAESLERFPEAYGISAAEFVKLTGITLVRPNIKEQPESPETEEVVRHPVYALPSKTLGPDDVVKHDYVYQPHATSQLTIVEMTDDSMAPEFSQGDWVYVDRQSTALVENKVYLVQTPEGFVLRRVMTLGSERFLMADNRGFSSMKLADLPVLGRAYYHRPSGRSV